MIGRGTLCTMSLAFAAAMVPSAFGEARVFLTRPGAQASVPTTGSHTIMVTPGELLTLEVWVDDTSPQQLGGYQVAIPGSAAVVVGTGSVTYVNTPTGSVLVDEARLDWAFAGQNGVSVFTSETGLPSGFAMIALLPFGLGTVVPDLAYLGEFQMQVSADAGGQFELVILPPGAPPNGGTALTDQTGAGQVTATLQSLLLAIPPANDNCAGAIAIPAGDTPFQTATATNSIPNGNFGGAGNGLCADNGDDTIDKDIWFTHTAACSGVMTVSTCNQATYDSRLEIYSGCGVCPTSSLIACNDDGVGCSGGTSEADFNAVAGNCYTIRVGGRDATASGQGTLSLVSDTCFIDGICRTPGQSNPANECEVCDPTQAVGAWSPRPAGTACTSDGNACTDNACNGAGACVATNNSAPCNDGLFCNGADTCGGGSCSVHAGDPCAAGADCANICNEAADSCNAPAGTACASDGNSCTNDVCNGSGVCTHPATPAGTLCTDDGNPCTNNTCNGFGSCVATNNNAPCNDGIFCNGTDLCASGSCSLHTGDPCVGGGECANLCDEAGDTCNRPAGTACASDGVQCTLDQCDGAGACAHPPSPAGTPCMDDGDVCTTDACDGAGACAHPPAVAGTPCPDDGDVCTEDACDGAGACAHPPALAGTACPDDGNDCTFDECDGAGVCAHPPADSGTLCDDGLPCTGTGEPGVGDDTCDGAGVCSGNLDPSCANLCVDAAVAVEGSNVTNNTGFGTELQVSCAFNSTADTWYIHTANCDGILLFTTTGSDFDTVLTLFDECGGPELACDDDGGPGLASAIQFNVTAGEDYFLRVAGFNGATGNVLLNITRQDTCRVDAVCYSDGTINPANECEECDAGDDPDAWSGRIKGTACGSQVPSNPQCDSPDSCNGVGVCEPNFKPAGNPCGDLSDSECDNPDSCDGAGLCAANFEPTGFACGDPSDTGCDNPDSCDGVGACLDNFEAGGTACGSQADSQCDNPDTCDGTGTCLDNFESTGFSCGDAADTDCDNPDSCDGAGGCLTNFEDFGFACGDGTTTECDSPDSCNGSGFCLPNFVLPGTACGDPADTPCDNPDSCDGSGVCEPNFEVTGAACGDPADTDCDNPDACDGSGGCAGNLEPVGTACGSPADTECDNPDSCDGTGVCLTNFETGGVACGSSADTQCDNPDSCTGSGTCASNFEPAGVACGDASDDECDNPDSCDGAGLCQFNFEPLGVACGDPANTACDNPDGCDGVGGCAGNGEPDGTPCPNGVFCDGDETCQGAVCVDGSTPCIDDLHCDEGGQFCIECLNTNECADQSPANGIIDDACIWYACVDETCEETPRVFGDVGGPFGDCMIDGFSNIHDKNHVLTCFSNTNPCDAINIDIGGSFGACPPDGFCNVHDANHVLAAFDGSTTCSCPAGPAPESAPVVTGQAKLRLVAGQRTVAPGGTVAVRVFVDGTLDAIQSYQLHLASTGGERSVLELVGIAVEDRKDTLFRAEATFEAFNSTNGQMLRGMDAGDVTSTDGYLATFEYRVPRSAAGTFVIDVLHDAANGDQTFLIGGGFTRIEVIGTTPALITVSPNTLSRTAQR